MTKLLTFGSFSIPHMGHAILLGKLSELADEVVVGVNSDHKIVETGKPLPVFWLKERMDLIEALGYRTLPIDRMAKELIDSEEPDIIAAGDDWDRERWLPTLGVDDAYLSERNIAVMFVPYTPYISCTEIRRRLA